MLNKSLFFILLILLSFKLSAQTVDIEIEIEGVKNDFLDNVQTYFSLEQQITDSGVLYSHILQLHGNVLPYITLEQQKTHPRLSKRRIKRLHKQAVAEIKKSLQPFGYYRVEVSSQLTPPSEENDAWLAHYSITLGEAIRIQALDIQINGEAEDDQAFTKLLADFPQKVGDVLNHPNYEQSKTILSQLAEERGYFDAKFNKHSIEIDEQAYAVTIRLYFDSGPRYRFGVVTFQQNIFETSVLKRFLSFKAGDFYTGHALLAFKNALLNSDYFENVKIDMPHSTDSSDVHLPVVVLLKPRKPNKYSASIGYGTDTGVRGGLGWERRYANRYGHSISSDVEASEIRESTTVRYTIPMGEHIGEFINITAGYKDESPDTSDSKLLLLGIRKHQPRFFLGSNINEIIGLEYRDDRYNVGSDSGHSRLLMPSISWSYMKADDRIYTKQGYKIQLEFRGALSEVVSNTSFWQTRLNGTLIFPLLKKGRLILRGEGGYSDISLLDGNFHELPPSIRFFAGGDRSVRGYDYQALGPLNDDEEVIGGKHLLVGSIEYEYKLFNLEKWSIAAFWDGGNAFNGLSEPLKQGGGMGIRWLSPIGLIRIDVAAALSEVGTPLRLHINIGPDL